MTAWSISGAAVPGWISHVYGLCPVLVEVLSLSWPFEVLLYTPPSACLCWVQFFRSLAILTSTWFIFYKTICTNGSLHGFAGLGTINLNSSRVWPGLFLSGQRTCKEFILFYLELSSGKWLSIIFPSHNMIGWIYLSDLFEVQMTETVLRIRGTYL